MEIVPAIDLRNGACVRMRRGDPATAIVYDEDPVRRAIAFVAGGAQRLHVVDIDAALGTGENLDTVARICRAVDVPVQTGGGIRSVERAVELAECGATGIILGTVLVEDEALALRIVQRLPGRAIAAIDARGPRIATRGWQRDSGADRDRFVGRVFTLGIGRIIFTEIGRDGMGSGFDIEALNTVAAQTRCRITASGGARTLEDVERLADEAHPNIDSCIVGSALYQGTMSMTR